MYLKEPLLSVSPYFIRICPPALQEDHPGYLAVG